MLGSILSFSPEHADFVSEYCEKHSEDITSEMHQQWNWTAQSFGDADKMSSKLQAQFFSWLAQILNPKRILEIGCYSGFSATAWYEGTRHTQAKIMTLEINSDMIRASRELFDRLDINDRITLLEGPAGDSIAKLHEQFDLVFVDANKDGYESYVKQILDKKLLSPNGVILCDNVFARGLTFGSEFNPHLAKEKRPYWAACGKALDHFNKAMYEDARVSVVILPLFDGVSMIKWKESAQGANGVANGVTNGEASVKKMHVENGMPSKEIA